MKFSNLQPIVKGASIFFFSSAVSKACGSSQAGDQICATAVTMLDPEPTETPGNS